MNYRRKNLLSFKITMWLNTNLAHRIPVGEDIMQTLFFLLTHVCFIEQNPALKTEVSFQIISKVGSQICYCIDN